MPPSGDALGVDGKLKSRLEWPYAWTCMLYGHNSFHINLTRYRIHVFFIVLCAHVYKIHSFIAAVVVFNYMYLGLKLRSEASK